MTCGPVRAGSEDEDLDDTEEKLSRLSLGDLPDLHDTWGSRAFRMPSPDAVAGNEENVITGPWSGASPSEGWERPTGPSWTTEDVRELRGAVYRRDAAAVVELVAPRSVIEVAHLAAPGLLHAAEAGHDPARLVMVRLMDELGERGWLGDDELVDEFERVVMGVPSDLRPAPVDLEELATHLDASPEFDEGWMLELATGRFWPRDPMAMMGEEEPDDFDDPEAFTAVLGFGSSVGYGDMRDFIATVTDERLAERLAVAIDGKGAFRRFKDTLYDDDEWREAWMRFSSERWLARARWWLADAGLCPATGRL